MRSTAATAAAAKERRNFLHFSLIYHQNGGKVQ
jgi:hypothetical protein